MEKKIPSAKSKKIKNPVINYRTTNLKMLNELVEYSRIGIFRTNIKGNFLFCNSSFISLLGYKSFDEMKHINAADGIYALADDRTRMLKILQKRNSIEKFQVYFKSRTQKPIPVLLSVRAKLDKAGEIKYIDGFIEDISMLKENENRIKKVNEDLQLLNCINVSLSKLLDLDDLLNKCMNVILSNFSGDVGGVLYRIQDDWMVPEALYPEEKSQLFFPIKIGSSNEHANLSSEVYVNKRGLIVNNTHDKKFLKKYPLFKTEHAHSFAIFPVFNLEECIGVLNLFSDDVGYFDEDKVELFRAIVTQLSVYIHNAETHQHTIQRIDEARKKLDEVNLSYNISNRLSAHLEFDKIINECFAILKEHSFLSAKIYLTSEDEQSLDLLSYYNSPDLPLPQIKIESGNLFSGLAVSSKKPVIINDSHSSEALKIDSRLKNRERHSFAAFPILLGEKCLGALTISSDEINKFKKSDLTFCEVIARQLSFVLNNAVLHSQSLKRNNELAQLYNTINRLSKHISIKDLLSEAFEIFKEMGFTSGKIYKLSDDNSTLLLLSSFSEKPGNFLNEIKIGELFSGRAALELKPIIIDDSHSTEALKIDRELINRPRHSFASFPMEYEGKCIGVINLVGDEVFQFSPAVNNLCINITKQLSLLINNSEVHEKTVKRNKEVNLLYDITKRLSLHISLNGIISECFEFFKGLGFTDGKLYLNNDNNLELFALYSNSKIIPEVPKRISEGNYFSTIAFKTGKPLVINNTHKDEMCNIFPEMINLKAHSFAIFPVVYGDTKSGVLNLACDEPEGFDEFILNLIPNITRNLGVLINNSQLYEEVIRKNRDLRLLNELSHDMNKIMNIEESGLTISKKLEEIFDYDGFYIDLYDARKDKLSNIINIDLIDGKKEYFKGQQNRNIDSPLIRQILQQKEPTLLLRENETDKIFNLSPFGDTSKRALSLMYCPLFTENEILGIIAVHSYRKNAFNNEDLTLLNGIANYISISIKNILLYRDLGDSENRYKSLIGNAPEAIFSFDNEGIFTAANSRTCEFLQTSETELIGKPVISFFPEQFRKFYLNKFISVMKKGLPETFDIKMSNDKYYETTIVPIIEENTASGYYVGITRDITSQKLAEENNIRTQQQLNENKKHEFIVNMTRNIAHVFNNVLVNVLSRSSFAKTLVEKDSIIFPHLEKIEISSKRVSELVKQLLIFAQSGNYLIEVLDLNKIIQFFFYSKKPQLKLNIEFELDLSETTPFVICNRDQIIVMLDKLFTNSVEAVGSKGKIILSSRIVQVTEQNFSNAQKIESGTYGKFSVIDNGCGVREDIRNRFFEPFNTTKEYGRGLGLPSVFGIIMNLNGYINIISEIDKGTEVEIYLPLGTKPK